MVSKICLIIDVNDDNKFMPAAIYQPPVKIYKQDTYMYILFITYLRFFSEGIYANTISSINRHIGRALLILDLYRTEQKEKFNLISLC